MPFIEPQLQRPRLPGRDSQSAADATRLVEAGGELLAGGDLPTFMRGRFIDEERKQ